MTDKDAIKALEAEVTELRGLVADFADQAEQRDVQRDKDLLTLATMMLDHQGAKPSLIEIIQRHSPEQVSA